MSAARVAVRDAVELTNVLIRHYGRLLRMAALALVGRANRVDYQGRWLD